MRRLFATDQLADVERGGRHHRFDHESSLWYANWYRCLLDRWDGDAYANAKYVAKLRIALAIVDDHETARIGQALDSTYRGNAAERREHHREVERQRMCFLVLALLVNLGDVHLIGINFVDPGVGDPLDVALAHL